MADMQVTSARVVAHLKSLRDMIQRASAVMHQTSLAISGSQAEVKRQAIEIARLRKELEDAASKNEAERTLFLSVKKRSATQDNALEKELQVANQQVQSLEANVFELANNFTQLQGALKTEQKAYRDMDKAYKDTLALLITMAKSAKHDAKAAYETISSLISDRNSSSLAEGSDALKAEQAAHAATRKALETAQTQLEAEAASLASTKKELSEAATRREALEKVLQVANQQVQSLEANVQELAIKFTHLEGVLKTEQEAHRDTDKSYKDAEKKGTALQKNVASLQQELEDAKKAAEDTRASLCGEASQLSDSLDKARAELRELALDRDALINEAKGLTEKRVHILRVNARVFSPGKVQISLTFEKFG
jgi:chromosome segregation ATPase